VVDYDLAVGDIVQYDPFSPMPTTAQQSNVLATTQAAENHAVAIGPVVGAPNIGAAYRAAGASAAVTAIGADVVPTPADIGINTLPIQPRLFVVTHIHPDINRRSDPQNSNSSLARQRDGGWIDICLLGTVDALFYKNTDILVPAGTPLGLYMPATSAAVSSVFKFGSGTANTGKPAFTNLTDTDLDRTFTTAATTIRNLLDTLSRIQAIAAEEDATVANGGTTASTTTLRRVSLGGWTFGA